MIVMNLDVSKEIRRAVDTGKVSFGFKSAEKILSHKNPKLIVISKSIPKLHSEKIMHYSDVSEVPYYFFEGTAHDLGAVCGKPFVVSVLTIEDEGKSKALSLAKK